MQLVGRLLSAVILFSIPTSGVGAAPASGAVEPAPRPVAPVVAGRRPTLPQPTRRPLVFFHPTVQQAWQTAASHGRPLVVMFTSDNCRYCNKMLSETYGHPAIQQLLAAHSETVLAHAQANRALVEQLGIRAYPTSMVVSPQGTIVAAMEGYMTPQAFAQRVRPLIAPSPNATAAIHTAGVSPVAARIDGGR